MGKPITTRDTGICFAFPDVCFTQAGPATVPIPYPNIGKLEETDRDTVAKSVLATGNEVITSNSRITNTTGDEAGQTGVTSGSPVSGSVKFVKCSNTVFAEGGRVVRMFDTTEQNIGSSNIANAVGTVLAGVPTVLVGD